MRHFILIIFLLLTLHSCSKPEIIFIDDVVQPKEQLNRLTPSEIFSYTKYQYEEAPQHYYRGADTIVIVVKTKTVETRLQQQRHKLLARFLDLADKGTDILFVLDGSLVMSDAQKYLRTISSDQLSNVDTMEWNAAKKIYGSPARPITVIVNKYIPKYKYTPN